jgi:hypothetical protein
VTPNLSYAAFLFRSMSAVLGDRISMTSRVASRVTHSARWLIVS